MDNEFTHEEPTRKYTKPEWRLIMDEKWEAAQDYARRMLSWSEDDLRLLDERFDALVLP